ncbi:dnaJ subfamily C member 21 [Biomphalaria glabrata]|nr:dnaJ subfamily C member 21 [Biomphalaria glabrata]
MMTNVLLVTICAFMSVKVGWADPEMSNETDIRLLTSAVSSFSRDVYRTLHRRAVNFVFSPFTAHSALSMTYMGAMHDTMRHLRDGLWLRDLPSPHMAYHDLIHDVTEVEDMQFLVANGMWVNPKFELHQKYKEDLATLYNAASGTIDLNATLGTEAAINEWVANQTMNKITSFLPPPKIDSSTLLLLINALYVNGTWMSKFNPSETSKDTFQLATGGLVETDFMTQTSYFEVKRSVVMDVDVIRIPFQNKRFAFYVALPKSRSGLSDFEDVFSNPNFDVNILFKEMKPEKIHLKLPKFKLVANINLNITLRFLIMSIVFDEIANFAGISDQQVRVSDVVQKAVIEINELGVTAASATAVKFVPTSTWEEDEPTDFIAGHPFMFFLRDDNNELILFHGRFSDPNITEIIIE